jgi:hypothetical protein
MASGAPQNLPGSNGSSISTWKAKGTKKLTVKLLLKGRQLGTSANQSAKHPLFFLEALQAQPETRVFGSGERHTGMNGGQGTVWRSQH